MAICETDVNNRRETCVGVGACTPSQRGRRDSLVRRRQRGVHAAVVARLPVSRDSSSEPESAAGVIKPVLNAGGPLP